MAATIPQTQSNFHLQPVDDDMEISSDVGHDQDIDIDIDVDNNFTPRPTDDDVMQDDIRSQGDHFVERDDVMIDNNTDQVEDGIMVDDQVDLTFEDEHLTDASEVGFHNQTFNDNTLFDNTEEDITEDASLYPENQQTLEENDVQGNERYSGVEEQDLQATDPVFTSVDTSTETSFQPDASTTIFENSNTNKHDTEPSETSPSKQEPVEGSSTPPHHPSASPQNSKPSSPVHVVDAGQSTKPQSESPQGHSTAESPEVVTAPQDYTSENSKRDAWPAEQAEAAEAEDPENEDSDSSFHELHPIIVFYDSAKLSLFPPPQGSELPEQFFLQDESYALKSLGELLEACRTVLGSTISEAEELELAIADLDLTISEKSTHDASICLSDILNVYLDLQRHDGVEYPEPLVLTLVRSKNFSSKFEVLRQAVKDGIGLSQLEITQYHADDQYFAENDNGSGSGADEEDTEGDTEEHQGEYDENDRADAEEYVDGRADENTNYDADQDAEDKLVEHVTEEAADEATETLQLGNTSAYTEDSVAHDVGEDSALRTSDHSTTNIHHDASQSESTPAQGEPTEIEKQEPYLTNEFETTTEILNEDEVSGATQDVNFEINTFSGLGDETSLTQPITSGIDDADFPQILGSGDFGVIAEESGLEALNQDLVYYEEAENGARGALSSGSSTLQGERGHHEPNEDLTNLDDLTHELAPNDDEHSNQLEHGEAYDDSNYAEAWIADDVQDHPDLTHDDFSHFTASSETIQHDDHKPIQTEKTKDSLNTSQDKTQQESQAVAEEGDDWQVFMEGDNYTEDHADQDTYDFDASADIPLGESLGLDQDAEEDAIDYGNQDDEHPAKDGATAPDSPPRKRTWDEQNDGLHNVLDDQDSKRVRAD